MGNEREPKPNEELTTVDNEINKPQDLQEHVKLPEGANNGEGGVVVASPGDPEPKLVERTKLPGSTKHDTGVEGEKEIWHGRYSFKNFIGRGILLVVLTLAWVGGVAYVFATTGDGANIRNVVQALGVLVGLFWLWSILQMIRARLTRFYRLTNRRIFVSDGIFRRRRAQIELLSVQDVDVDQPSLLHRWFEIGHVTVKSSDENEPILGILGINHPFALMDLIWHYSRAEREGRAWQVDQI